MKTLLIFILLILATKATAQESIGYPFGIPIENGAVPVVVSDQHSEPINLYFCDHSASTTLAADADIGDDQISVTSAAGAILYGAFGVYENGHVWQTLTSAIDGTTITTASRSDYNFSAGATVYFGNWDMSVDGSTTPVVYYIGPPPGVKWDIYELIISMEDNTAMYESTFAGIAALTKPLTARVVDGFSKQLFVINNNGGFREQGFIVDYPAKVPAGTYAFGAYKNFPQTLGVSIRLDGDAGDRIEIPVRDNLTGITKVAMTVQGHVVVDSPEQTLTSYSVAKNSWVKIVNGGTVGSIHINDNYYISTNAFLIIKNAGESAPTAYPSESGSGAIAVDSMNIPFSSPMPIDIYIWSYKYDIGVVIEGI